jgi:hypothetical protein
LKRDKNSNVGVTRVKALACVLNAQSLGAGYSGPETYSDGCEFSTDDGSITGGVWSYDGILTSSNPGQTHQLWIVISGNIKISLEEEIIEASSNDLVLFEAPYPMKTIEASKDFRAIWIGVECRRTT